jgi:hypothetical protein
MGRHSRVVREENASVLGEFSDRGWGVIAGASRLASWLACTGVVCG